MEGTRMKWIFLSIIGAIVGGGIYLSNYLGYFKPVTVTEVQEPAKKILLKKHFGPYHKIVPTIRDVESWARGNNLPCTLSFGHYIDDPNLVDQDRLRSRGGCLVEVFPDKMPEGFEVDTIPAGKYVKATFEGSPGIGPFKVYPTVLSHIASQGLKRDEALGVFEIYEIHNDQSMTTSYFFPLKEEPSL
jgi:AraC family transcriptional regulator